MRAVPLQFVCNRCQLGRFRLSCSMWTDPDGDEPLQYLFGYKVSSASSGSSSDDVTWLAPTSRNFISSVFPSGTVVLYGETSCCISSVFRLFRLFQSECVWSRVLPIFLQCTLFFLRNNPCMCACGLCSHTHAVICIMYMYVCMYIYIYIYIYIHVHTHILTRVFVCAQLPS
jgi:hypothetical protein